MKNLAYIILGLATVVLFQACSDNDEVTTTSELQLNISGLEDLGDDYTYEGWIIVDGAPVTTGLFDVDATGNLSRSSFNIDSELLNLATAFVLTIEPSPDPDPAPSAVHILAGDFDAQSADLTVDHGSAIGDDFLSSTGEYILATPTDGGDDTDETSGVWWLNPTNGPSAGLSLPTLPEGWIYEGWAVVDGIPVSTGRFSEASGADDLDIYSGDIAAPPFPGEDLLQNAPAGLSFPVDLAGKTVVISVEPVPDNSPAPFTLKPLVGQVPNDAQDRAVYDMNNNANATNPIGSAAILQN